MKSELILRKRSGGERHFNLASLKIEKKDEKRKQGKKEEVGEREEREGMRKMSAYDYGMNFELFLLFQPKTFECSSLLRYFKGCTGTCISFFISPLKKRYEFLKKGKQQVFTVYKCSWK